ncbi:MAG: hypothetical protein AAF489_11485 [Bacteroidota bacterium]
MAPIKFEENIREKLQEREIRPSKDSWNELSKKLGHAPAPKNNRRLWMAVAAGFMGLLLVVSYVLTTSDEDQPIQLVDKNTTTPSEVEEAIQTPQLEDPAINEAPVIASENTGNDKEKPVIEGRNKILPKKNIAVAKDKSDKTKNSTTINEAALIEKQEIAEINPNLKAITNNKSVPKQEDAFVENKVDAVVAAVRQMEESNNTVTAEEIDALLSKAQRDIATNRILSSSNEKIDPSALLRDVESEMERSFRDKVFEALGEGYNKVRTAVVERNN